MAIWNGAWPATRIRGKTAAGRPCKGRGGVRQSHRQSYAKAGIVPKARKPMEKNGLQPGASQAKLICRRNAKIRRCLVMFEPNQEKGLC